ncbi:MAG: hypothetical protein MMC23_004522 [Stictis urceolatum]|nr:hypothetical protein [Stictis urceolata]
MTILKIPHGLPVPNPTQSYWQTPPLGISNERTTPDLPGSAKYVIVGSGISGALTAYKLLQQEPAADIVMLEARTACSGATGRNGGHCRAGRYLSFKDDLEKFGLEEALRLETLEETTVQRIGKLVHDENIKCDLRAVETCDIVTEQKDWDEMVDVVKIREKYTADHPQVTKRKLWFGEEARKEFLVPAAVGAVTFPAYSLSPYKLVCALLHLNIAKGMNLQTTTPVIRLSKDESSDKIRWSVYTKRGVVRADRVILATNAYTAALYPLLTDFLIPTRAQVAAVRPGSNIVGNPALKRTCGMTTSESGDYLQSRAKGLSGEGDIIVGKPID